MFKMDWKLVCRF